MTREEQINVTAQTRVSTTMGAIAMFVGFASGAIGATVGWKIATEGRIATSERTIEDHETRLRKLETDVVGGLADIKAELRGIKERLK